MGKHNKISEKQIEELINLYVNTNLPKREIYKQLNITEYTLTKTIKELNLIRNKKMRPRLINIKYIDLEKVKLMREDLYSYEYIAKIFNVSRELIVIRIKDSGIYIDESVPCNKKLAGKVNKIIEFYLKTKSASKTAKEFNSDIEVITNLLKTKNIMQSRANNNVQQHYLYETWKGIKKRCLNSNNKDYANYGGRGITVCEEWRESFIVFRDYIEENLGQRPEKYSLDRINNNGNYEPGNVRWASAKEQAQNKRKILKCRYFYF